MKTLIILASVAALTFISLSERSNSKDTAGDCKQPACVTIMKAAPEETGFCNKNNAQSNEDDGSGASFMKFASKNFFIL